MHMIYDVEFTQEAINGLQKLRRNEPSAYRKAQKLMNEIAIHPTTGTGHPHQLSGDRAGQWSCSITKKHRLVYQIKETEVLVLVLTAYGHYDDK